MKGKISLNNFIQENMKRNIIYSLTGILIFVLTACTDDWLNNEGERMPEGEVSVSSVRLHGANLPQSYCNCWFLTSGGIAGSDR